MPNTPSVITRIPPAFCFADERRGSLQLFFEIGRVVVFENNGDPDAGVPHR